MRGVVYKYTSPSGKVYIGQTCREQKRRNEFLRKDGMYTRGSFIEEARRKYGPENFLYEVLFAAEGTNKKEIVDTLSHWEEYYISEYKSTDRRFGYNMAKGATCNVGIVLSEESRKRMSEKSKERQAKYNPMKGKKHKSESIEKMRAHSKPRYGKDNHNFGKRPPQELLDRLIEMSKQRTGENNPFFGKTHSKEFIEKQRERYSRPVVQVDAKTFEEIATFPSATAAAESIGNKKRVVEICKVCNRYKKPNGIQSVTAYGYRWRWVGDEPFVVEARISPPPSFKGQHLTQEMKDNISRINSKSVCQLDPNTLEVIAIHKSCQAAANALGHPRSNSDIGKMCNGKPTKGKVLGYKWKWLNQ